MKQNKKILSLILGVLMLFSCIVPVSAEATSALSVGVVTGEAGSTVIVPITIDKNSGFISLSMYLTYDTSALTLIAVHDTGLISGSYHSPYYDSPYYLSWINDERTTNYTSTGLIVELEFLIDEDAKNQDYPIIVRMNTDGALDKNGNEVTFTLNSGKITVAESEHVCSFGDWKKQNSKKHARVCSECGEYEEEKHNWNDGEVIEEPSCGVDGEILYTCEDCGYEDYEWIDAEPHDYGDWISLNADEHMRICSNCENRDVEDHNWVLNGNNLVCEDCGETNSEPHTHSFVEYYTFSPSCTQSGYTEYICEGCGEMKQDDFVSALGHYYVNGVCERCDAVDPNPNRIPVTGITLSETGLTMKVGDGKWIDATVLPGNATNQLVIWESSDTSIVDIAASGDNNQRGLAVARANGTAIITATTADGGFVARCVVTVTKDEISDYSEGLEYTSNGDGTCYVSGMGNCTDTELVIPSIYNGMSVVGIGRDAFSRNTNITGVVIPNSVAKIDWYAFYQCTALAEIIIPGSVKEIGNRAFAGCTNLKKAVFMDGATSVGLFMFENCSYLKEVILSNTITEIKQGAFRWCGGLTKITLSSNLTTIGELAFQSCRKLTSISLPSGLQTIDEDAFFDCNGLTSIDVPSSVTSIGEGAFEECDNLSAINIDNAYYRSVDGVLYNNDVTKLLCCPSGKSGSVIIPDGVTELGNKAFYYGKVTQITIPKSLVRVGDHAFFQCGSLTDVYYYGTEAQWSLIENIDDTYDNQSVYAATIHYLGEDDPTPPVPTTTATIVVDSKEAMPGETIKVNVNLTDNPGLASAILNVSFDTRILTLQSVEYNSAMGGQTVYPQNMNSPVTLYWVSPFADMSEDCVFATLTFKVSENAKEGDNTTVNISYDADNVYNLAEENVALNVKPGTVTVIDYIPGDINGDGVLNNKDVTRLMQYFAGWDVTVNTPALDVNNDGSHNNKDVTRLMQYLAGWDVEIH